jgi:hypothetical protein
MEQDKKTKKFNKIPDLKEYAKYHKERMEKWHTGDVFWYNVNAVGIMQALPNNDGLYLGAIDLDNKTKDSKITEIQSYFLEQLNPEIKSCMSKTANNGMHLYFYSPKPIDGNTRHHDSTGIEILAGKRFIVVYPSLNYTKPTSNDALVMENYEEIETALQKTINHFSLEEKKTAVNSYILSPSILHAPNPSRRGLSEPNVFCIHHNDAVNVYTLKMRPCLREVLKSDLFGTVGHNVRVAVAVELLANGYSVDEVVSCFSGQKDFDVNVSRRQVESLRGYNHYRCEKLKSFGICEGVKCKYKKNHDDESVICGWKD